jgi:hypothetical protein
LNVLHLGRVLRGGLELQEIGADDVDGESDAHEEYAAIEKRLHWTIFSFVSSAGARMFFPARCLPGPNFIGSHTGTRSNCGMAAMRGGKKLRVNDETG